MMCSIPNTKHLIANKDSATDSFGIYCKKLLKEAKIDVGEIAINSIPEVPIWDSEPVTVDFTLSELDKSSTSSTVFKSRFNEVKQKYLAFCHIYTDGSKVETKVASAYVCPYGTRGYRLRDGCSIFTAVFSLLQKMLYQKHNLHILNYHVQMFLWRFNHLSHLCGRNGGIKRLVTNCMPSCPKLMRSITWDAQIEKMKLLLIVFE